MSYEKRIWYPNASYHITLRGNRRNDIFRDGEDFQIYLTLIQEAFMHFDYKFKIACYCLMDNHAHMLLQTYDKPLWYFITRLNSMYARYFNNKYNYIGHLYQDRYFAELIETDEQILDVSRYIHLNPLKAKMVEKAEEYSWSCYGVYLNLTEDKIIDKELILMYFKDKSVEFYKEFVDLGINILRRKEDDCNSISNK